MSEEDRRREMKHEIKYNDGETEQWHANEKVRTSQDGDEMNETRAKAHTLVYSMPSRGE